MWYLLHLVKNIPSCREHNHFFDSRAEAIAHAVRYLAWTYGPIVIADRDESKCVLEDVWEEVWQIDDKQRRAFFDSLNENEAT